MRSTSLVGTVVSLLLVNAVAAQNQTEASSTTKAEKAESTISSDESTKSVTSTSSSLESTSTVEEECKCSIQPDLYEWNWPQLNITEVLVAKVIVKVDRTTNESTTITSYIKEDATDVAQKPEDLWNIALNTTGISMSNGEPVYTITRSIYTAADKKDFFTTTQVIVRPDKVMDYGYRALVDDGAEFETITSPALETRITSCAAEQTQTTIALTPADGKYKVSVGSNEWDSMLPEVYVSRCERGARAPINAVNIQSALTETTTEYDDYQQSQVTTTSKKPDPTTPASTKATTTSAPKEPIKDGSSQNPPPSSQNPPPSSQQPSQNQPTQNQPAQSQPTQNEGAQNQPSQNQPAGNSPAPPASSFTSTQTQTQISTYTPVILGGATLTAGGSAATVSGTTYSLGSSSQLVVNGNTLSFASTSGGQGGLGTLIWEGLGGTVVTASQTGPVTATSTTVATFTGAASRLSGWVPQAMAVAMAGALFQML